ncbi:hypothetical protein B0H34DRAFT_240121 [Crassisporium funariophilum]|nr:hypothetical protein B0H34DRAFT_240121 [Crassisporium funariophilum]
MDSAAHRWDGIHYPPTNVGRIPSYSTEAVGPAEPIQEVSPHNSNGIVYPQVLDPDYGPQTIHRSDLFFITPPRMNSARQNAESSPVSSKASPSISNQLYPYHQQAFNHYSPQVAPPPHPQYTRPPYPYNQQVPYPESHLQRSSSSFGPPPPPPLPPKPIAYPPIGTNIPQYGIADHSYTYQPYTQPPPPRHDGEVVASPTEDSDELAMVLAISQSESAQQSALDVQLMNQEEEDLARALAESMLSTGSNAHPSENPFFAIPGTSNVATSSKHTLDASWPRSPSPKLSVEQPRKASLSKAASSSSGPTTAESSSHAGHAEFGRYDKWHIPGVTDKAMHGEAQVGESRSEKMQGEKGRTRSISSDSSLPYDIHFPESAASGSKTSADKRASISSASSLPYNIPASQNSPHDVKVSLPVYSQMDGADLRPTITTNHSQSDYGESDLSEALVSPGTILMFDDEAYARQLAAEEEEGAKVLYSWKEEEREEELRRAQQEESDLPTYTSYGHGKQRAEWQPPSGPSSNDTYEYRYPLETPVSSTSSIPPFKTPAQTIAGSFNQSLAHAIPPRHDSIPHEPQIRPMPLGDSGSQASFSPVVYPSLGPRRESDSDARSEASHYSSSQASAGVHSVHSDRPNLRLDMAQQGPITNGARRPSQSGPINVHQAHERLSNNPNPAPGPSVLNVNQFVDRNLLLGVSIGFKSPAISMRLMPMPDPMPNIISLPYARCPPLHIQAPDWRHLLRLMARLSGTRIEPTVEAMAVSKTDLKLRTVVQFIKVASILWNMVASRSSFLNPAASKRCRMANNTLVHD